MFNDLFKGKKVIITGNSGFKGSWLSLWLNKLGASVHGISYKPPSELNMFESLNLENKLKSFSKIDIANNPSEVDEIITKIEPDFLFHLAAQPLVSVSYQDPLFTIRTNVLGTANILNSIKNQSHRVVSVIITSDKCYDNLELKRGYEESDILGGKDIYSGSKGAAELVIKSFYHSFFKNHKFNSVIASARAGNVIGGGDWGKDRIVPDAVTSWNKSQKLHIRNPLSTRPWQHVLEPLSGYLTLAYKLYSDDNLNGESFNFGPNDSSNKTVAELIKGLSERWGFANQNDSFTVKHTEDFHEAGLLQLDCKKASEILEWAPNLSFDEMINFSCDWYKEFYSNDEIETILLRTENQIEDYVNIAKNKNYHWVN
tara:strand:- start:2911 stop:4023 length:1113 start_codon:yes stop_codon:yes gene_type:complete